jgi:hypothetical protein
VTAFLLVAALLLVALSALLIGAAVAVDRGWDWLAAVLASAAVALLIAATAYLVQLGEVAR